MARTRPLHVLATALVVALPSLAAAPPEQLAQAVDAQRTLVAERPEDAGALNDLANLLVEQGEYEEAEESYRRAMALEPARTEPQYNLSLLLAGRNRNREARRLLKALLHEHPGHAWGHYQLGTLRQAKGDRGRALNSYREAFRLDPTLSDPRRNPHVLDNPLATAAMLAAFDLIAPAATSQRIYVDRSRITGLLLPSLVAEPEPSTEEAEAPQEPAAEPTNEEPAAAPDDAGG